jgi:demethylmenaquinone methyltransferase/2-methoxy-6-polyprenyl-1,4-benzoquinol methylase
MEAILGSWRIEVRRIPPTQQELARMYDRAAAHWHRSMRRLGYGRAYVALLAELERAGELGRVARGEVLDCGVGTGAFSLALAGAGVRPVRLHGVDIAPRMLEEARRVLGAAGLEVALRHHDLRDLPFGDDRFAMVMCAHALEHLPDPGAGLREMVRVLRPGAPLVLVATRRGPLGTCLRLRWRNACLDPAALEEAARGAGLESVRLLPLRAGPPWCGGSSIALVGRKADHSTRSAVEGSSAAARRAGSHAAAVATTSRNATTAP